MHNAKSVSVEFRKSRKNRNKIRKYFSLFIRGPEVENLVNCQLVSWLPIARRSAAVHSRAGGVVTSLASCSALCTATRLSWPSWLQDLFSIMDCPPDGPDCPQDWPDCPQDWPDCPPDWPDCSQDWPDCSQDWPTSSSDRLRRGSLLLFSTCPPLVEVSTSACPPDRRMLMADSR